MLAEVVKYIAYGVGTIGSIMAAWGGVQCGLALGSSHGQAAGADLAPGIAAMVGGAIIIVVGVIIGNIDTSWAN